VEPPDRCVEELVPVVTASAPEVRTTWEYLTFAAHNELRRESLGRGVSTKEHRTKSNRHSSSSRGLLSDISARNGINGLLKGF